MGWLNLLYVSAVLVVSAVGAIAQEVARPDDDPLLKQIQTPAAITVPRCSAPAYTPVPPPDLIQDAWNKKKKYRLVIGASEFVASPDMNRDFVAPTAALVDSKLKRLGYSALPSRVKDPYIVGKKATKPAILAALKEMALAIGKDDVGVVYYVGHGLISLNRSDLSLGVYDEPVAPENGLRVSDIVGVLELTKYVSSIKEIPHLLIVIEACDSGESTLGSQTVLVNDSDVQRIKMIQNQLVPEQVAILAATTHGGNNGAYPLRGSGASAFGYYFARALDEDWSCADSVTPDGILTIEELNDYLTERLDNAYKKHFIDGQMRPTSLAKDDASFLAYLPDRHSIDGVRSRILRLTFEPQAQGEIAEIILPNGERHTCEQVGGCSVLVSANLKGKLQQFAFGKIIVRSDGAMIGGILGNVVGLADQAPTPTPLRISESTDFQELVQKKQVSGAGVSVSVQR